LRPGALIKRSGFAGVEIGFGVGVDDGEGTGIVMVG